MVHIPTGACIGQNFDPASMLGIQKMTQSRDVQRGDQVVAPEGFLEEKTNAQVGASFHFLNGNL